VRDEQRGAAKELVYNEKVDVVCGPINSGEVLPTLGVISGAKTLQMVGGVIDELIDPGCGLFSVPSMSCVRPGTAVEGRWSSVGRLCTEIPGEPQEGVDTPGDQTPLASCCWLKKRPGSIRASIPPALSMSVSQSQTLSARHGLRPPLDIQLGENMFDM
jgi:hypothetical protein